MATQNFLVKKAAETTGSAASGEPDMGSAAASDLDLPDLVAPDPLIVPEPISSGLDQVSPPLPDTESSAPVPPAAASPPSMPEPNPIESSAPLASQPVSPPISQPVNQSVNQPVYATQLQTLSARLRQVQTDTLIEIPRQLSIVRIGKPNDQTPPDVDVSGFPNSEVVSRVHANLRVEGDVYYIEDVGSSNGTYINGLPLAAGNRHRLRQGDRIALGKGDKISFIFEMA